MLPTYEKPFLGISEQLALLQARGLKVTDVARAERYLERIGYYRLSGYWYPMRKPIAAEPGKKAASRHDEFLEGAEFRHAIQLYVFDKRLRLLFLDAIERIEIGLRVAVALRLGARDPVAHRNPEELHPDFAYKLDSRTFCSPHFAWLEKQDKLEEASKEEFSKHFKSRYSSKLPIWIAIEVWDFGQLSHFFAGLRVQDKEAISSAHGLVDWRLLQSWLRAINFVRNVCAHHGRLWNRKLIDIPKRPKPGEILTLDHVAANQTVWHKLYSVAVILQFLMLKINPASTWAARLKSLTNEFPAAPGISLAQAGFPDSWWNLDVWAARAEDL